MLKSTTKYAQRNHVNKIVVIITIQYNKIKMKEIGKVIYSLSNE